MTQATVKVIKPNAGGFFSTMMSDGEWYGGTKVAPHYADGTALIVGDEVTFDITMNGKYKNLNYGSLTKVVGQAAPSTVAQSTSSGGGLSRDDYWANKEARDIETGKVIQFQAARNSAISVLMPLLINGDLPAFGGKKATHVDQFMGMLMDTTLRMVEEAKVQGESSFTPPTVDADD